MTLRAGTSSSGSKVLHQINVGNLVDQGPAAGFGSLDPDAILNAMIASFVGDQTELVQVITGLIS
jgi:hypothetical protein